MTHMGKVYAAEQRTEEAAKLMTMLRTRADLETWAAGQGTERFTLFVLRTSWQPDNYNTYQLCPGVGWDPREHPYIAPELGRQLDTWDFRFSAYDRMLHDGQTIVSDFSGSLDYGTLLSRLERGIDPLTHTINGKERRSWTMK